MVLKQSKAHILIIDVILDGNDSPKGFRQLFGLVQAACIVRFTKSLTKPSAISVAIKPLKVTGFIS